MVASGHLPCQNLGTEPELSGNREHSNMGKLEPLTEAEAFLSALEKSGLVTADELRKLREQPPGPDAKTVARFLIKEGQLTKWQAQQLLHGFSRLVIGKYKLLDQLGKGPTGRVYLAEHAQLGKRVSLKELARRFSSQAEILKQFLDQANRAAALNHRNLTHIFDVGHDDERYYLVMEYVEGLDLKRLVENTGRLTPRQALELLRQASDGLSHAHEHQLYHGDLKPTNLLVDADGVVKILDLGTSGLSQLPAVGGSEESTEGPSLFAVAFRPLELRPKGSHADARADIYALGAVLYYLLTGKVPPCDKPPAIEDLTAHAVAAELAQLCVRMMSTQPDQRPQSAAEVASELQRQLRAASAAEKPTEERAAERPSSGGKPKRPLVAKPLADAAGATVVSAEPDQADELAAFAIQTKRKRGAPAAAVARSGASAPGSGAAAASKRRRRDPRPWIIGGAISGGILAVAATVTIVLLILNRDTSRLPSDGKTLAKSNSQSAAPLAKEVSPQAPEANPEANPSAALETGKVASEAANRPPDQPATLPATTPATKDSPVATPPMAEPEPAKTEPPKTEPTKTEPAKTEPLKGEPAKSEPAKAPPSKTEVAAAEPQPLPAPAAPPGNPFEGFPTAVSLPALEKMGKPAEEAVAPAPLGTIKLDPKAHCYITLKGGKNAAKTRQSFTLEPANQGTALRDWEFKLQTEGGAPLVVATMSLKEDQLLFQWADAAIGNSVVPHLCNCVLSMTAGAGKHEVALRKPQILEPITLELDRGGMESKCSLDYLPNSKQVVVELGPMEGGPTKFKLDPKTQLGALKDSTYLWLGNSDDALVLGFKIDVSMSAKTLELKGLPQYKIEGMTRPDRYVKTTANRLSQESLAKLQAATISVERLKRLPTSQNRQAETLKAQQLNLASQEVERAQRTQAQVEQLKQLAEAVGGKAKLHYRIYYEADDSTKVELVTTGAPPPLETPAPAARAGFHPALRRTGSSELERPTAATAYQHTQHERASAGRFSQATRVGPPGSPRVQPRSVVRRTHGQLR
jgi:serine/threonine-protein kinase